MAKIKRVRVVDPANRFNMSIDEWEELVFRNATYYTSFRLYSGRHKRDTRRFGTFPAAMKDASKDDRALVYAVSPTGRQACLDRSKWDRYMEVWNEMKVVSKSKPD